MKIDMTPEAIAKLFIRSDDDICVQDNCQVAQRYCGKAAQ